VGRVFQKAGRGVKQWFVATVVRLRPDAPRPLAPFGEPAAALPLLDLPLAQFQERQVQEAGAELVEVRASDPLPAGTRAVFTADACFSAAALSALLQGARSGVVQAATPPGTPLFDFVQPLSGQPADRPYRAPVWAGDLQGVGTTADGPAIEAEALEVCDEVDHFEVRVAPGGPPPHVLRVPRVERLAARVSHWLHVLNLNQALLASERRARGLLASDNALADDAEVHPTALVEGSILAAGAAVEHHASVLGSYIGEGVRVADHAVLVDCVIGAGCHTLVDTHLRRVIAFGGSTLSNLHSEDLLLGREVFITTGVSFFGSTPGRSAVVDGEDTRRPVLGGCAGHKCVLGARALFGGGVAVPAGTVIVMRPDEGIVKMTEAGLARAHTIFGDPTRDA
jgi:carbonic anhydrase/acetyltransferase-like protein (isoleucine patch superfamily)